MQRGAVFLLHWLCAQSIQAQSASCGMGGGKEPVKKKKALIPHYHLPGDSGTPSFGSGNKSFS